MPWRPENGVVEDRGCELGSGHQRRLRTLSGEKEVILVDIGPSGRKKWHFWVFFVETHAIGGFTNVADLRSIGCGLEDER